MVSVDGNCTLEIYQYHHPSFLNNSVNSFEIEKYFPGIKLSMPWKHIAVSPSKISVKNVKHHLFKLKSVPNKQAKT